MSKSKRRTSREHSGAYTAPKGEVTNARAEAESLRHERRTPLIPGWLVVVLVVVALIAGSLLFSGGGVGHVEGGPQDTGDHGS